MKHFLLLIPVLFMILIFTSISWAQEYTGDRIKLLVSQIDSSITSFEAKTTGYDMELKNLQQEADEIYKGVMKAEDNLQKESLLSDLLFTQAKLHRLDWNYIQATKGTLYELVPRLNLLATEVEKTANMGFANSSDYQQYKTHLGSFLINSAQILKGVVSAIDDPQLKRQIRDAALALQSAKFGLSGGSQSKKTNIADVQEMIRLLENSVAQLQSIENALLQEKFSLQLEGYRSMVRLVVNQLNIDGPLSVSKLPSFVESSIERIQSRNNNLNSAVGHVAGSGAVLTNIDYISDDATEKLLDDILK
jgi:hypothetical protein